MDWLGARGELGDGCVLAGEGEAGTWALVAAIADERVASVATIGMLASYRMILENKWNNVRGYFRVPKALEVYDLPDLPALVAPRSVALINTVEQMVHPLDDAAMRDEFSRVREWYGNEGLTIVGGAVAEGTA